MARRSSTSCRKAASPAALHMRDQRFQLAVMNSTEPRASDVAAFENDLRTHKVKALIYNSQATDSAAKDCWGSPRPRACPSWA